MKSPRNQGTSSGKTRLPSPSAIRVLWFQLLSSST